MAKGTLPHNHVAALSHAARVFAAAVFPHADAEEREGWCALFPILSDITPGTTVPSMGRAAFKDLIAVSQSLPQAERSYAKGRWSGETLLRRLSGMSLTEAMRAAASEPGCWGLSVQNSAREKEWGTRRPLSHMWAAHVEFERSGRCPSFGALSFPCALRWFPEFLKRTAELRAAAIQSRLDRAESLLDPEIAFRVSEIEAAKALRAQFTSLICIGEPWPTN